MNVELELTKVKAVADVLVMSNDTRPTLKEMLYDRIVDGKTFQEAITEVWPKPDDSKEVRENAPSVVSRSD